MQGLWDWRSEDRHYLQPSSIADVDWKLSTCSFNLVSVDITHTIITQILLAAFITSLPATDILTLEVKQMRKVAKKIHYLIVK